MQGDRAARMHGERCTKYPEKQKFRFALPSASRGPTERGDRDIRDDPSDQESGNRVRVHVGGSLRLRVFPCGPPWPQPLEKA